MPRGRRRSTLDLASLEQELELLKQRQADLRAEMRKLRSGASGIRKLQEKLEKQLASARWTAGEIRQLQPDWDELGFYQSVTAKPPTPRGRRPRTTPEAGE